MDSIEEMGAIIARHAPGDGMHDSAIERLMLIRSSTPTEPLHVVYDPALCLVVQGCKQAVLADRTYRYDAANFLLVTVDLPIVGCVVEASPERPYLCIALRLNLPVLADLMLDCAAPTAAPAAAMSGVALGETDAGLLDAVCRLLRLLDSPEDAAMLGPLAEREILYRLLRGPQGAIARHIAAADSHLRRISRAIGWIRRHFAEPISVERLAAEAAMSPSSFHEHFRAVTAMSPLQFRTRLRLMEARRLIVSEGLDAAGAGFRVGYESPSQFSRDYSRTFGLPPLRDAARLRAGPQPRWWRKKKAPEGALPFTFNGSAHAASSYSSPPPWTGPESWPLAEKSRSTSSMIAIAAASEARRPALMIRV
jgi:AraC-like DNA-binding protein